MDWQAWLTQYGYLAILVGTFFEGETILVLGGYAAHEGYLLLPWVIVSAFCGSFAGDQLAFFIGRRHGKTLLAKYPKWQARVARVHGLMERFHTIFILGFRFLYGLRTVSPLVLGTSDVSTRRYFFLNMIGGVVWAITVACLGYAFGQVVELAIGRVKEYQGYVLGGLLVVGAVVTGVLQVRARRQAKAAAAQQQVAAAAAAALAEPTAHVPAGKDLHQA